MCDFCNNIYKNKEDYLKENDLYDFFDSDDGAYYNKDGLVDYFALCDDPYYSKPVLMDMKYCPFCGEDMAHLGKNV